MSKVVIKLKKKAGKKLLRFYEMMVSFIQCQRLTFLYVSNQFRIVIITLIIAISLISVATNLILVRALKKSNEFNSFSDHFMTLICYSDICFATISQPMLVFHHMIAINNKENCLLEFLIVVTSYFFMYFSFFMLIDIAVLRYLLLTKLSRYDLYTNKSRGRLIILVNLLASASFSVVASAPKNIYFQAQIVFTIVGSTLITIICYLYFIVLRRVGRLIHVQPAKNGRNGAVSIQTLTKTKRKQTVRTVGSLLLALVLLYTPYNCVTLVRSYYLYYKNTSPGYTLDVVASCFTLPVYSFTVVNAVIYGWGTAAVRRYWNSIFSLNPS